MPAVPALVIQVDESSIRDYLVLSDSLPLLVLFVDPSDAQSEGLLGTIGQISNSLAGKLLTLVVDATASPSLAAAFEVQQLPALFGLLKGQPAPLFAGNQPLEQVQLVVNRVLEVAAENGLTGSVSVAPQQSEPELPETHKKAFEAIDSGDYPAALEHYRKALLENPNDSLAEAGIAQVNLLMRLEGQDVLALAEQKASTDAERLLRADALVATGQAEQAFSEVLKLFEETPKDSREEIRLRLVELFQVVGIDQPAVAKARRDLSLLLF
jgi:putative thioredoxin